MYRSVGWQPGEHSEAPHSCPQWSTLTCATSGLPSADRTDGRRPCDASGSRAAGVVHGPDAAETEPCHANPEASGFGSSGDPSGAGVQVCVSWLWCHRTTKHLDLYLNWHLDCESAFRFQNIQLLFYFKCVSNILPNFPGFSVTVAHYESKACLCMDKTVAKFRTVKFRKCRTVLLKWLSNWWLSSFHSFCILQIAGSNCTPDPGTGEFARLSAPRSED